MPIYEYHCDDCGAYVELLLRRSEDEPVCPHCGTLLTQKLFSVPYVSKGFSTREPGRTCCGRDERCETPACSAGGECRHEA
jgi:putative FmdB family regulatory protein